MATNLKDLGWKKSAYDSTKIINSSNSTTVTITSWGAQDNRGNKIHSQSTNQVTDWIRKRS